MKQNPTILDSQAMTCPASRCLLYSVSWLRQAASLQGVIGRFVLSPLIALCIPWAVRAEGLQLSDMRVLQPLANTSAPSAEKQAPSYTVAFSTYLGGQEVDDLREVIPYPDGSVLVSGLSSSPDIPITGAVLQPTYAGEAVGPDRPFTGMYGGDCYLARLNANGKGIQYATYFGGSKQERSVYGMELDSQGNIVVTTTTRSRDLPTTDRAFQRMYQGGISDWMVAKFSPDLSRLLWCTYVGGSGPEEPRGGLDVDKWDNVYIVGSAGSSDFPLTDGAFRGAPQGSGSGAVVKLTPDGSDVVYGANLYSGVIVGARVGDVGNCIVAGRTNAADFAGTAGAAQTKLGGKADAFVASLSADGGALLFATLLGGSGVELPEHRLWLDPQGHVLLTGITGSSDFPRTPGAFRSSQGGSFLTRISRYGRSFDFSTVFRGSGGTSFMVPVPDREGNIHIVGYTSAADFPVTPTALQGHGGGNDGLLAVISPDGSRLLYATYLGGCGNDVIRSIAFGPNDEIFLVGRTHSDDFPVTSGALQTKYGGRSDGFVVKLVPR